MPKQIEHEDGINESQPLMSKMGEMGLLHTKVDRLSADSPEQERLLEKSLGNARKP